MKLFKLRDKNNKTTDLFRIEDFTTVEEVIDRLNKYFDIVVENECDSLYTDDKEGNFNYVYVSNDGFLRFVESLTEFCEGFQSEEEWKVDNSVEVN